MRALLCFGLVAALACGDDDGATDAGTDTSTSDVGTDDAGGDDAGTDDAGGDDAGTDDAGGDDAGTDDAGPTDAAMDAFDADIMECAASTLRFESPLPQMTNGSGDDFDPSGDDCPFAIGTGPDRVYALVPSLGVGTYRVTATPVGALDWNPMIYTLTDCTGDTCLDGTNLNGVGEADSLDIVVDDDSVITYVVVDTALDGNPSGGPFMLATELLE